MTARLDQRWAEFVMRSGLAFTPDQFKALTRAQVDACVRESRRLAKRR